MNTQQLMERLIEKQRELGARHFRREDIAVEKTAETLDEIQQDAHRLVAIDSLSRQWKTTSLISEALERLEDNTYGICQECDEPISEKRLAALPWAKYCIHCQDSVVKAQPRMSWAQAA